MYRDIGAGDGLLGTTDAGGYLGRSARRAERREPNCLRRFGPERAGELGFAA
jgi:hypothetical protein